MSHDNQETIVGDAEQPLGLEHPSYEELEAKLTETEQGREQLLRALAEKENQLRRVQGELEKERKYAVTKLVQDLLAVVDSLEKGLELITDDNHKQGIALTFQMLQNTLSKYGVEVVNPENQPFDPAFHEAMSMQPSESVPAGQVLNVLQKGYVLHGRLIRPAMVIVSA
ncbi:MAG: nucleotide exchange factor GrpE [Gammaproteobacteria bacterium]